MLKERGGKEEGINDIVICHAKINQSSNMIFMYMFIIAILNPIGFYLKNLKKVIIIYYFYEGVYILHL